MSERIQRLSRRKFLLTLGAGGTAAAATLVAKNVQPVAPLEDKSKRGGSGYRDSEHIRNYYRTAKV